MNIISAKTKYEKDIVRLMREKFGYKNNMAVPKVVKVVVNCGIGKISKENDKVEEIFNSLGQIAGQKPVKTKTKKAIAGFKTREGQDVGIKITLRGRRMWQFIDRMINASLPRVRDFQGIEGNKAVDQKGNLNIGFKEHIIFPEIKAEKVKHIFGFQVNLTTNAKTKEEGRELFKLLGFPIKDTN